MPKYLSMADRVPNGEPINDAIAAMQRKRRVYLQWKAFTRTPFYDAHPRGVRCAICAVRYNEWPALFTHYLEHAEQMNHRELAALAEAIDKYPHYNVSRGEIEEAAQELDSDH